MEILKRYFASEMVINYHLKKDFSISLVFIYQIRVLHLFSYLLMLFSDKPPYTVVGCLLYLHSFFLFYMAVLNIYIMLYCNTPTTEFILQGIKTVSYLAGGSFMAHNALSVYFIPPNDISNSYHIYSPTGRGYGAYSCSQLLAVDALKGSQGSNFDYKSIVDEHNMICSKLVSKEFAKSPDLPPYKDYLAKSLLKSNIKD